MKIMHNMCKYMCVRFIYVMNTVFDIHVHGQTSLVQTSGDQWKHHNKQHLMSPGTFVHPGVYRNYFGKLVRSV